VTIGTNLVQIYKALGGGWNLEDPARPMTAASADKPAVQQIAAATSAAPAAK